MRIPPGNRLEALLGDWIGQYSMRTEDSDTLDFADTHLGDFAPVGEGVNELRMFFGTGYRVYFGEQDNQIVVLLCGGDKSSQSQDIEQAKAYWKEYP